jgi:hypothetical protein
VMCSSARGAYAESRTMAEKEWEPPTPTPLRARLQQITDELVAERRDEQVNAIEALQREFAHSITLVERADPNRRFNCYQFAFDLQVLPGPVALLCQLYDFVYPGRRFVRHLADTHLERIGRDDACHGDIVVWAQGDFIKHAGKIAGTGSVSKWGEGHTWSHGLFEVPWGYGSDLTFYRAIPPDAALRAFVEFARQETAGDDAVDALLEDI